MADFKLALLLSLTLIGLKTFGPERVTAFEFSCQIHKDAGRINGLAADRCPKRSPWDFGMGMAEGKFIGKQCNKFKGKSCALAWVVNFVKGLLTNNKECILNGKLDDFVSGVLLGFEKEQAEKCRTSYPPAQSTCGHLSVKLLASGIQDPTKYVYDSCNGERAEDDGRSLGEVIGQLCLDGCNDNHKENPVEAFALIWTCKKNSKFWKSYESGYQTGNGQRGTCKGQCARWYSEGYLDGYTDYSNCFSEEKGETAAERKCYSGLPENCIGGYLDGFKDAQESKNRVCGLQMDEYEPGNIDKAYAKGFRAAYAECPKSG